MRISQLFRIFLFLLPLLEIAGFILVGGWIGVLPTLLLIVITTILGFVILRIQGFMTLMKVQRRLQAGEHPAMDVLGGALLMFGGLLLVLPGFITDIIGLLLLIPVIRDLVLRWLVKSGVLVAGHAKPKPRSVQGRVIEGEFKHENKKNNRC
jgi:UPF0716 protein FxsA